jgi:hypothetical protein
LKEEVDLWTVNELISIGLQDSIVSLTSHGELLLRVKTEPFDNTRSKLEVEC